MNQELAKITSLEQWQAAFKVHLAEPLNHHETALVNGRRVCTECQQFLTQMGAVL